MTKVSCRWTCIATALLAIGCTGPTESGPAPQPLITTLPRALSADERVAATATTDFGLALFRTVNARTARDSNLALSPVSASLALGMLLVGADGETRDQVRGTLGFGTRAVGEVAASYKALVPLLTALDPSVQLRFANAAWFDVGSPPSAAFRQTLADAFAARADTLPFAAPATLATINAWVSGATNARIPTILDRLDPDAIALLVNATWFKGQWRSRFDPARTRGADFFVAPSTTVRVPTMSSTRALVRMGADPGGVVIGELPFGGDAFVMTIAMPPAGTLEPFIDGLTPARWQALLDRLPARTDTLLVELPKFRLEVTRRLNADLAALGMPAPFTRANLDPMFLVPASNRALSSVTHKVYVDVNEEGAEAAAVTAVGIVAVSLPPSLVVNRPFVFAIRERLSGTILFLGKVVRPAVP